MIYYEVVHQVVVFASNFHNLIISYSSGSVKLVAWGLSLGACRPGPQSSVQLVKPGSSSFTAPSDSMSCSRSFSDLTFFISYNIPELVDCQACLDPDFLWAGPPA